MSEPEREPMLAVSYTDAIKTVWVLASSDGPVVFGNVAHRDTFGAEFMIEGSTPQGDLLVRWHESGLTWSAKPWSLVDHWNWVPFQEA